MSRNNLLIVCCGDNSFHDRWIRKDRSYDVITIYYGDKPDKMDFYRSISDMFFVEKGFKIELARKVLLHHLRFQRNFNFSDYEYIWFPDDDLHFTAHDGQIEDLFIAAKNVAADVFQPAVSNDYFSTRWQSTRKIVGAYAHRTNIVEVMAHGFSGDCFEKCY